MIKKLLILLFAFVVTIPLARAVFAQEAAAQAKKEARWEGRVIRTDKEHSTLTVRKEGSTIEKTVQYDASTKWVSQYHADKKLNDIDASQVKEEDYVICKGTLDKDGKLHATLISKRLSHSPAS
jgi:biopolymer transport protein ExbD